MQRTRRKEWVNCFLLGELGRERFSRDPLCGSLGFFCAFHGVARPHAIIGATRFARLVDEGSFWGLGGVGAATGRDRHQ